MGVPFAAIAMFSMAALVGCGDNVESIPIDRCDVRLRQVFDLVAVDVTSTCHTDSLVWWTLWGSDGHIARTGHGSPCPGGLSEQAFVPIVDGRVDGYVATATMLIDGHDEVPCLNQ